jgi:hypothetical protein
VLLLSLLTVAHACESSPEQENSCVAVITKSRVLAYFPVAIEKSIWKWYQKERTRERPEYGWIAESGICKRGEFLSTGIAFAASIGTMSLEKTPPAEGKLSDLLNATSKNSFYRSPPKGKEQEDRHFNFSRQSVVEAKAIAFEGAKIVLTAADVETFHAITRGKSTHLRMRAILPEVEESYECVTKMMNVDAP